MQLTRSPSKSQILSQPTKWTHCTISSVHHSNHPETASQIPDSFPRSASGQFLIRNGRVDSERQFKSILKYQKTILTELSTHKAESFLRVAMSLDNSVDMVSLLLEAGLKDDSATQSLDDVEESKWMDKGWTELHVATTFDQTGERGCAKGDSRMVKVLVELGGALLNRG
ncbi:ankyrin repeat-containing protein [Tanacetum coccineum]